MTWVDVLRALCAVLAIVLVPACAYSMARVDTADQKLRFAALAMLGVVVVAWQIEAWGHALHWRVPLLALALSLALLGTVRFLIRTRRGLED